MSDHFQGNGVSGEFWSNAELAGAMRDETQRVASHYQIQSLIYPKYSENIRARATDSRNDLREVILEYDHRKRLLYEVEIDALNDAEHRINLSHDRVSRLPTPRTLSAANLTTWMHREWKAILATTTSFITVLISIVGFALHQSGANVGPVTLIGVVAIGGLTSQGIALLVHMYISARTADRIGDQKVEIKSLSAALREQQKRNDALEEKYARMRKRIAASDRVFFDLRFKRNQFVDELTRVNMRVTQAPRWTLANQRERLRALGREVEKSTRDYVESIVQALADIHSARLGKFERDYSAYFVLMKPGDGGPAFEIVTNRPVQRDLRWSAGGDRSATIVALHAVYNEALKTEVLRIDDLRAFVEGARKGRHYRYPEIGENEGLVSCLVIPVRSRTLSLDFGVLDARAGLVLDSVVGPDGQPVVGLLVLEAAGVNLLKEPGFDFESTLDVMQELAVDVADSYKRELELKGIIAAMIMGNLTDFRRHGRRARSA